MLAVTPRKVHALFCVQQVFNITLRFPHRRKGEMQKFKAESRGKIRHLFNHPGMNPRLPHNTFLPDFLPPCLTSLKTAGVRFIWLGRNTAGAVRATPGRRISRRIRSARLCLEATGRSCRRRMTLPQGKSLSLGLIWGHLGFLRKPRWRNLTRRCRNCFRVRFVTSMLPSFSRFVIIQNRSIYCPRIKNIQYPLFDPG